jgi:hypothetical protein
VLARVGRELVTDGELEESAEGVVNAVERVLGAEALTACDGGEGFTAFANGARQRGERVFGDVGGHAPSLNVSTAKDLTLRRKKCRRRDILQDEATSHG